MSGSSVGNLLTKAQLPNTVGGVRTSKDELVAAWKEAQKPEGGDPAGKPITTAEAQLFKDLVSKPMTAAAKRFLVNEILPKLSTLTAGDTPNVGTNTSLTPPGAAKPVYINADGWAVAQADLAGTPALNQAEEGLYRLALRISQVGQVGERVKALDDLPVATRTKLADNAIAMAKKSLGAGAAPLEGLSANKTNQLRSSAFTLLWNLAASLPSSGPTSQLQARIHGELIKMTEAEPQKFLARHMARMLDRSEYQKNLTADQKADTKEVFEAKHPQKFDVKNLLDAQGYISWEHACGEGEGFYKSFVLNLPKQSLAGAKFEKKASGYGYTDFELKFNPARGENGQVKGIKIRVREFNDDMYSSVGQKKGFSYGGHSNIGENQENSMIKALAQGLKANQPQLAMFDLCAGIDNLDDALENLGDLEVLTTFGSSYFWKGQLKDENGSTFEGVRESEGMKTLMAVFESLSREEGYEKMRSRVSNEIYNYQHMRNPNVVFPTYGDYREVRWMHLDGDGDGRMDANDMLYQLGLKKLTFDPNKEFNLKDNGPIDELSGESPKNAILDLNVATHYNATTLGSKIEHNFSSAGWFTTTDPTELVRFSSATNHDGKKMVEVSFNAGLAHASREALEALTQYSAIVQLSDQGQISGLSEVDRKLMGLTFAAFRLNSDGQGRLNDQRIWKQLLETMRLPWDMPYGALASLLDGEHHDYSGNMDIVKKYKATLSADTLKALEAKAVGRTGTDAPSAPVG
jgi:hypothetical protein